MRLHRRKCCRELRAWVATGSYLSDRVRGYDPGNDLAQRDVDYSDYIPCQGRPNMATRAHLNLIESPQISEPLACRRAQPRKLGALLEHAWPLAEVCGDRTAVWKRTHLNMGRSWQAGGRRLAGEVCRRNVTWP